MRKDSKSNIKIWEEQHPNNIKSICTFEFKPRFKEGYYTLEVSCNALYAYYNAWEKDIHTTEQRKEWIQKAVEKLHYVVEKSKRELTDNRGDSSLQEYYNGFANRAVLCKLVECAPKESWYGDWVKDGAPHFVIGVFKTYKYLDNKMQQDGTYYIWCCGNDDFDMAKRNLTLEEATELFNLAIDGVSQDELRAFGIVTE